MLSFRDEAGPKAWSELTSGETGVFPSGICVGFWWKSISKDKQRDVASELRVY